MVSGKLQNGSSEDTEETSNESESSELLSQSITGQVLAPSADHADTDQSELVATKRVRYVLENCSRPWKDTLDSIRTKKKNLREDTYRNEPIWKQMLTAKRILGSKK